MLESCVNQAAGLIGLAAQSAPRVLAMVSHGKQDGELPLLWNLCSALVDMGHSVAVLDSTTEESERNPGLQQLLLDNRRDGLDAAAAWSVFPAAHGLAQLCQAAAPGAATLAPLHGLFDNFEVIVLYASANVLSQLLPNTGVQPLLTVAPVKMSPLTAYQALKQMLLSAKLRPTVATMESGIFSNTAMNANTSIRNLQECAMTFLGYRLDALTVRGAEHGDAAGDDVARLALRLLENAMPLHRNPLLGTH
jgi:hypothetical protein